LPPGQAGSAAAGLSKARLPRWQMRAGSVARVRFTSQAITLEVRWATLSTR